MSPELKLYYLGRPLKSIAGSAGVGVKVMSGRLFRERKVLGMNPLRKGRKWISSNVQEFIDDKALVLELYHSGTNMSQLAEKWDIDRSTVYDYMTEWGLIADSTGDIKSISLSSLYTDWANINEDMILTVNKRPMFKLTRLRG